MCKLDILSAIDEICKERYSGAYSRELLKYCDDDDQLLLQKLGHFMYEGLIDVGIHESGSGTDDAGQLICAENITLTDEGKKYLQFQKAIEENNLFNVCKNFWIEHWKWILTFVVVGVGGLIVKGC